MNNTYMTIVNAINKSATLVSVNDYEGAPTAEYTWRVYNKGEFEDIKELLEILCISYDDDWDTCDSLLTATVNVRKSKTLTIKVKYIHEYEW